MRSTWEEPVPEAVDCAPGCIVFVSDFELVTCVPFLLSLDNALLDVDLGGDGCTDRVLEEEVLLLFEGANGLELTRRCSGELELPQPLKHSVPVRSNTSKVVF